MATEPTVDKTDRQSIINWLCWNDPHGIWTDEANRAEGYDPLPLELAREIYEDMNTRDYP